MPCNTREKQLAAQLKCYYNNKEKYYAYRLEYWRQNQLRLIDYLKSHPCVDCGELDIVILEFDHLNPKQKLATVSDMVRQGCAWNRIAIEIEKCDVVCTNCHRRRTNTNYKTARYRFKYPLDQSAPLYKQHKRTGAPRKPSVENGVDKTKLTSLERRHLSKKKYRQSHRDQQYAYRMKRYYECRDRFLLYLSGRSCIVCTESDILVLEFDHRNPADKKIDIAVAVGRGWKWETLLEEINKCDVLCGNCHKRRTHSDINSARFQSQVVLE